MQILVNTVRFQLRSKDGRLVNLFKSLVVLPRVQRLNYEAGRHPSIILRSRAPKPSLERNPVIFRR